MVVGNLSNMEWEAIEAENVKGASKKITVGPIDGWDDHVMRFFKLEVGGHTPRHTHDWPHINYVVKGNGTVHINGVDHEISAGSYAFVPSNELHQFQNTGDEALEFMCIVPLRGHA